MKAKYAMAVVVWGVIIALIYFGNQNRIAGAVANTAFDIVFLTLVIAGSAYKLALWFRHRNDPEKREAVVFSTRLYPEKIRKFLMDEGGEDKRRNR